MPTADGGVGRMGGRALVAAVVTAGVAVWMRGGTRLAAMGGLVQWVAATVGVRGWWWLRAVLGAVFVVAAVVLYMAWRVAVSDQNRGWTVVTHA
jgi:hypothetical protein